MEVVANNYLPGDQRLVDKIVYELKAQGIFDQFRKECFADVDTKPAYQNLRQRVEGSVTGFLKEQSWRPDMNKNQVREMLRKRITESGYLETGVERIVDQVVNPKINTVFLPQVEEVVYSYLGIKKPSKSEKSEQCDDLLPTDLEAVSPESEPVDKKDDKSTDTFQDLDETKTEEDESPPFEPLEEQTTYVPQEENSVDSHMSGFSGLASHESNQSNENKITPMEQDSQMSRNSSDSRLSIITSDDNSKMDICEDSQSKSIKSTDSNHKHDDKKHKSSERHKSRSESKSDKDRKSSKDSRSRHSSSSKDKDKSRDRRDSKSSSKPKENDKDKSKDKDRNRSSSKHTSSKDKDKNAKKDSRSDKDKPRSSSSHKSRDKSSDSKSKEKSSSDRHKHSSSHSDRHKKDKDKKKDSKLKDDHYSSKDKRNDRRSTDRDSNDGQSSRPPTNPSDNSNSQSQKSQDSNSGGGDSGNSDHTESTTKAPVVITGAVENSEVMISPPETQRVKVLKPKCASNIQEALKLMKIRKQLAKLEKQNQLSLASVDVTSPIVLSSSINLDDLNQNCLKKEHENKIEDVVPHLQNTVISQDSWDTMEAKLREAVCQEMDESGDEDEKCRFFESVDIKKIEFLQFVELFISKFEKYQRLRKRNGGKRKIEDNDLKNNNKQLKKQKVGKSKTTNKNNNHAVANEKFPLPLSPAESDKSTGKKEEISTPKAKRNNVNKVNNQRYSSDDLYKPRPTFISTRRRGAKNLEN
ncbi:biorientation of chromosomes in cell division protein 1-like 1 [Tribolium castaneum]|uniref:BOD1/SHG1 domain-containing protein n=1 Tax=Tribolium castaneum TaxID=7070 RepID=D6X0P1_TRICA|nr:PREDICTED: biorientation of chromosomes in cell division protein 1-like 1 [Tribolium castaneum]EFA10124.1 hypothetical protein TcasGA2_TC012304 [Tribolium castaneum]|eukprot:XP_008197598.1 PREDICTED: biorientation of chromosomes in cell division protein 1-like 1 [Tribolium castaneum]